MKTQLPSKYPWNSSREPLRVPEPQVENNWFKSWIYLLIKVFQRVHFFLDEVRKALGLHPSAPPTGQPYCLQESRDLVELQFSPTKRKLVQALLCRLVGKTLIEMRENSLETYEPRNKTSDLHGFWQKIGSERVIYFVKC